jgi:hypothetical protein
MGQNQQSKFDLSQFSAALAKVHPMLRVALDKITDAINNLGQNLGANATGYSATPHPIQAITVKNVGETYHVTHTDFAAGEKNTHYFTEIGVNDPAFLQPIVLHHGPSRGGPPFTLPTNDDLGHLVKYYFQGYKQSPGSLPSQKVMFGGGVPTAVTGTGTTHMTLLPSTGSGTSSGTGQQSGSGFGKTLTKEQGL